jgi:hypothetical protein
MRAATSGLTALIRYTDRTEYVPVEEDGVGEVVVLRLFTIFSKGVHIGRLFLSHAVI